MEKSVFSISGKPGLFMFLKRGTNTLIVETLDETHKRFAVSTHDKITSLNDVSMYTTEDDISLKIVLENIKKKFDGKPVDINPKKASKKELEDFMVSVLPNYDAERVYQNDIRKLISWYNILINNGITDFEKEPEEEKSEQPQSADTESADTESEAK